MLAGVSMGRFYVTSQDGFEVLCFHEKKILVMGLIHPWGESLFSNYSVSQSYARLEWVGGTGGKTQST